MRGRGLVFINSGSMTSPRLADLPIDSPGAWTEIELPLHRSPTGEASLYLNFVEGTLDLQRIVFC